METLIKKGPNRPQAGTPVGYFELQPSHLPHDEGFSSPEMLIPRVAYQTTPVTQKQLNDENQQRKVAKHVSIFFSQIEE